MKKFELLASSAIVLLAAQPAFAQTQPTPPPAGEETPADQSDLAEDDQSQDIVVTSTKRETTLLDTPIAVSVTSGATIEQAQIRDLRDLQTVVPSLRVNQLQSSANTNFIIRGFGNGANNAGIEPSVGVFIDGVYRSRSAAQISDLPNLKRIEVLRGPQSTLFGKNASAGIISIVTAEPSFEFGGSGEVTYGNYNAFIAKGDISGPITETIAYSLAGNYNRRDGFAQDLFLNEDINDRNRYGFRGQLLFQPSSDFKLRLIGDYDKIDENCCVAANVVSNPAIFAALQFASGSPTPLEAQQPFSYRVRNNFPSSNNIQNFGVSLQGDYSFDKFSITSISSYRGVRIETNQDSDFTQADLIGVNSNATDIDTYTQELRFTSDFDGPFNFLIGGFYFNEQIKTQDSILFGNDFRRYASGLANLLTGRPIGGPSAIDQVESQILALPAGTFFRAGTGLDTGYNYRDSSYSIFGQGDYKITDRLTLTFGFNYTDDRKRVSSQSTSTDVFSSLDFVAIGRQVVTQTAIATTVGGALGLGRPATAAEVGAFAAGNPAAFGQVQAGASAFGAANQSNPAVNSLLGLQPFQFLPPFLDFPNAVESGRTSDSNFSYTVRLAYKLNDHLSTYFTYATGFKASSFNLSRDSRPFASDFIPGSPVTNPATSPIRAAGLALPNLTTGFGNGGRFATPETAEVFEGGIKGQYPGVAFNIAVFKQALDGFQSNVFRGTGFTLINAERQSTFGIEFDGSYTPIKPLTLVFALTYLDPVYDSFTRSVQGDLSGQRPAGISEFSISGGATYTHSFDNGNKLLLRGDYQYDSPVASVDGADFAPFPREISSLNMAATFITKGGLELSLWGRNITDVQTLTTVFPSVAQTGSISGYPTQPRTFGGTVRIKF